MLIFFLFDQKSNSSVKESIRFNQATVLEIRGKSQCFESPVEVVLSEKDSSSLIEKFNRLDIEKTNEQVQEKGWLYWFSISYNNGGISNTALHYKHNILPFFSYLIEINCHTHFFPNNKKKNYIYYR